MFNENDLWQAQRNDKPPHIAPPSLLDQSQLSSCTNKLLLHRLEVLRVDAATRGFTPAPNNDMALTNTVKSRVQVFVSHVASEELIASIAESNLQPKYGTPTSPGSPVAWLHKCGDSGYAQFNATVKAVVVRGKALDSKNGMSQTAFD